MCPNNFSDEKGMVKVRLSSEDSTEHRDSSSALDERLKKEEREKYAKLSVANILLQKKQYELALSLTSKLYLSNETAQAFCYLL